MTPSERLRRLADWCDKHGITAEDIISLSADKWDADAQLTFPALVRLWPGRVFVPDDDGHIAFNDGDVRVACVLSFTERVKLMEAAK